MRARRQQIEKGSLELIEEATHLLRLAPVSALVLYYAGTIPFALGFLYFLADMSQSAFAFDRCAAASLFLSLLYVWMKSWQAAAAARWLSYAKGEPSPAWTLRKALRLTLIQASIQPTSLFVLPVSLIITLPFGWTWAFYQNATVLGQSDTAEACFKESARLSSIQQKQNHLLLIILSLFGAVCFSNMFILAIQTPGLIKMFLGIESVFTKGGQFWFFNTTFLAVVIVLTWLCVDPLIKAIYVLRCFYCQSIRTGEDIATELRQLPRTNGSAARTLGIALAVLLLAMSAPAQDAAPAPIAVSTNAHAVSANELDRSISTVLEKRDFAWRMPRHKAPSTDPNQGWFARSIQSTLLVLKQWARDLGEMARKTSNWLRDVFRDRSPTANTTPGSGAGWMTSLRFVFIVLIFVIAAILGLMIFRALRRRSSPSPVVNAQPTIAAPDLTDENVSAEQLPEDEWLKLAGELAGQGNLRVALRAYYLASLAHLARRDVIALARFKSNRDYERETRRRARTRPDLVAAFAENVSAFDRSWYGLREVTREVLDHFRENTERIRAC
jgi:hypothetical protein